jgi:predicted aconitase
MGFFFTRFSDLLTPSERERLAELEKKGIPQYIRDDVNNTADEYWKNFKLASYIAATICLGEPFERQQEVTALLETNQKKSRRNKAMLGVVAILFWCGVLYAVIKLAIWLNGQLF